MISMSLIDLLMIIHSKKNNQKNEMNDHPPQIHSSISDAEKTQNNYSKTGLLHRIVNESYNPMASPLTEIHKQKRYMIHAF